MLFLKKNINLILFILLLLLSITVLFYDKEIFNIETLENKNNELEDNNNCSGSIKIIQSSNSSNQVQTHNKIQDTIHKAKLQKCLFPLSQEEQIKQLNDQEKKSKN